MNKIKSTAILSIGIILTVTTGCNLFSKKEKVISVISFINHPIFNQIESSFKDELKKQLGEDYKYNLVENNAQGNADNLPSISSQVIALNPDIIVPISTPVTQSILRYVKPENKVVYTFVSDTMNLKDALQKTNTTGLSDVINYRANLELIQSIYGKKVNIGILYNPNEANSVKGVNEINELVKASPETKIIYSTIANQSDISLTANQMMKSVDVFLSIGDNTVGAGLKIIIDQAKEQHKAVFAIDEASIKELGALGGVSVDYDLLGRETAKVVASVLKDGKQPKDLPKIMFYGNTLIINSTTATALNITIQNYILSKAQVVK